MFISKFCSWICFDKYCKNEKENIKFMKVEGLEEIYEVWYIFMPSNSNINKYQSWNGTKMRTDRRKFIYLLG